MPIPARRASGEFATTEFATMRDGRRLAFVAVGAEEGVPVLFFHGIPGSRLLPPFAGPLAARLGLRLIAVDRPGYGLSDPKPKRTIADWPADMVDLTDALGIERFRILGMSGGGVYALACCVGIPERIERAGLVSGLTPRDEAGIAREGVPRVLRRAVRRSLRVSHAVHALLVLGVRRSPARALEGIARTLSPADQRALARPEMSDFIVASTLEAARQGVAGWVHDDWLLNQPWGFSPSDVPAHVPVDLWYGATDAAVPLAHAEELAGQVPGARLRVFDCEGHMSLLFERADEIFEDFASA